MFINTRIQIRIRLRSFIFVYILLSDSLASSILFLIPSLLNKTQSQLNASGDEARYQFNFSSYIQDNKGVSSYYQNQLLCYSSLVMHCEEMSARSRKVVNTATSTLLQPPNSIEW